MAQPHLLLNCLFFSVWRGYVRVRCGPNNGRVSGDQDELHTHAEKIATFFTINRENRTEIAEIGD